MKYLVNFTPHVLYMYDGDQVKATLQSVASARCAETRTSIGDINGLPDEIVGFGEVKVYSKLDNGKFSEVGVTFPYPAQDTIYIVSNVVAQKLAIEGRYKDIRVPSNMVRNAMNEVVGARGFARVC